MDEQYFTLILYFATGKGDFNVPLLNGFENGVNSGPESDEDKKYNQKNQKDATSGMLNTYLEDKLYNKNKLQQEEGRADSRLNIFLISLNFLLI